MLVLSLHKFDIADRGGASAIFRGLIDGDDDARNSEGRLNAKKLFGS